jgi:chromosome segregation ATPase
MAEQGQKTRNPFLDDFPGGLLIIGAVLLVFALDLLSGAKVIGVDQEKVAVKKEWKMLNREKEDFYRKKKDWDNIDELLAAGSSKLEALRNKLKDEADRRDELQKENKTLDESSQKLKSDISALEARKADISKQESTLLMGLTASQQKLGEVQTQSENLQGHNKDLVDKNKKLESRNALLEQETLNSEDLKNSIKSFVSYVEGLKTQTDKIVSVSAALDTKTQDSDQTAGAIQDNTTKLLTVSQSLQSALNNIITKIDESKTGISNTNRPNDNTDLSS